MTFDTHLITQALTALGITAGIAILMAIAITGIAASQLRGKSPARRVTSVPAQAPAAEAGREREPQAA